MLVSRALHGLRARLSASGLSATFLSGGTDGIDGPTDAAGAIVDQDFWGRCLAQDLDPEGALENNDTYTLLGSADGGRGGAVGEGNSSPIYYIG